MVLTETNKKLLSKVLRLGMSGSYYQSYDTPAGDDIEGFLNHEIDEISEKRIEEIASFYELGGRDLKEIISDEKDCAEWVEMRSIPWDDPW